MVVCDLAGSSLVRLTETFGNRRKDGLESGLGLGHEHPGVVFHVGFHQKQISEVRGFYQNGEKAQFVGALSIQGRPQFVRSLEGSMEAVFSLVGQRDVHLVGVREIELDSFFHDCDVIREGGYEAIGDSVVVGPDLQGVVAFETQTEIVID